MYAMFSAAKPTGFLVNKPFPTCQFPERAKLLQIYNIVLIVQKTLLKVPWLIYALKVLLFSS